MKYALPLILFAVAIAFYVAGLQWISALLIFGMVFELGGWISLFATNRKRPLSAG